MPDVVTINDQNWRSYVIPPGSHKTGLMVRDMKSSPRGSYFPVLSTRLPTIPRNEWQQRLDEQKAERARFIDYLRDNMGNNGGRIPSRDQDGEPYCWMHSGVSGMIALRAMMGLPYVDLSAFGPACKIKNFRSEGGWGAEGCKFLATHGCPSSATWPQQSKSRSHDNATTWAEAAKYKLVEYYELDDSEMMAQQVTVLLSGGVYVADRNWWSHSTLDCALESIDPFVVWTWNSWGDGWSQGGLGKIEGRKAVCSDATAMFAASAAA